MKLFKAMMEGASLRRTMMEGADLREAELGQADLSLATMNDVDLRWAEMENANLTRATIRGADLRWAMIEGAVLRGTLMEGANLREAEVASNQLNNAQMMGINFRGVSLWSLDLRFTQLSGAAVQSKENDEVINILPTQAFDFFADGSVRLPPGDNYDRPKHWCNEKLKYGAFLSRWRDWRERMNLPWPPPGRALAGLADHSSTPFDSPVQPHEIDPGWTPPAQ